MVRLTTSAAASCSSSRSESFVTSAFSGLRARSMMSVTVAAKLPPRSPRPLTTSSTRLETESLRFGSSRSLTCCSA